MNRYLKFIVALLSAALVAVHVIAARNGPLSSNDWLTIADAAGGALLVFLVPNGTSTFILPAQSSKNPS